MIDPLGLFGPCRLKEATRKQPGGLKLAVVTVTMLKNLHLGGKNITNASRAIGVGNCVQCDNGQSAAKIAKIGVSRIRKRILTSYRMPRKAQ
jgi:hypothetical protein